MSRARNTVTRLDVAKEAGVSQSTVSLVLNNHPKVRVSPETRARIFDAAAKLAYKPNVLGKALVTGRTNCIGVIIFHIDTPFNAYTNDLFAGIWTQLHQHSYRMTIDALPLDGDVSLFFRETPVDGIILVAPPPEVKNIDIIRNARFPLLTVGSNVVNADIDYIDLDNYQAGKQATEYLIANGHRKILHISGDVKGNTSAVDRLKGYRDAMNAAGIQYSEDMIISGDYHYDSAHKAIVKALDRNIQFTAIFSASDSMTPAVVDELEARNINIPEEISIIEISNSRNSSYQLKKITSINQCLQHIGETVAEAIMDKINNNKQAIQRRLFQGIFVDNGTVKTIK